MVRSIGAFPRIPVLVIPSPILVVLKAVKTGSTRPSLISAINKRHELVPTSIAASRSAKLNHTPSSHRLQHFHQGSGPCQVQRHESVPHQA